MPTEGERLAALKVQVDNIEKKVDEGFKNAKEDNSELKKMITDFIEKSENRFASKWVENAIKWFIGLVMTMVLSAIIYLVIKH